MTCKEAHSASTRTLADHLNRVHGFNLKPVAGRHETKGGLRVRGFRGMRLWFQMLHQDAIRKETTR